jgi:hypothetical protein
MADLEANRPPGSAWPARLAILGAVLLTLCAVAAIGWRWYHVRFPNAALFVRGTEATADAEVVISNEDGDEVYRGWLTSQTSYQVVALVEQGVYGVTVRREGATLVRDRMYVPNGSGVLVQVVSANSTSRPSTAPTTSPAGGIFRMPPATTSNVEPED